MVAGADKNDENIPVPLLEHGADVRNGSNSGSGNINVRGEGLEAMETWLEYQAPHSGIRRNFNFVFSFLILA